MADQPGIELSMLDAIQLFNNRPAAEWTPEELAAFRARMEATPNVVTLLGGRDKIERKLAEVAAAHTRAAAAPVAAVVEPGAAAVVPIHRDSKLLRRSLEVVLLLTLVLGAGYWTWTQLRSVLPKPVATLNPDGTKPATAAGVPANGAPKNPATTAAGAKPARPRVVNPDEPLVETWHDWTIAGAKDGRWTRVSEWDLTQPNAPTPVDRLTLEGSATPGATVTLSQRRPLLKDERWLELRARAMKPVAKPGAITVRLNGKTVAQMKVSGAEARWPVYAPLESAGSGKESLLEVVYETGEAGEQFAWRNLAFAPEKREVAKRINCGGPLVEAATGDWEADDKGNPALASTGTQIWSV
ncbi:MAG: hypothetical protein K8T25_16065, partial [Planctomycetia bacterium]|nr:hypothetical protein [Planctomycetia bacterium]